MITRSNPDVGYFGADVYKTFAYSQNVRAGNLLFVAGVTPLRGGVADLELVGEGDLRAQTQFVMDVLRKLLAAEGATFANWVEQTIYTTDIAELQKHVDIFQDAFGDDGPNQTWAEVNSLFVPGQLIEIKGIAVID